MIYPTPCHCPICGHSAERTYYEESVGIVEEEIVCHTCGFYYLFAYGAYLEIVGDKYFIWGYSASSDAPVFRRMRKAEFMARRRWKKHRKGTTCKDCPV